jgi:hypothetical protein
MIPMFRILSMGAIAAPRFEEKKEERVGEKVKGDGARLKKADRGEVEPLRASERNRNILLDQIRPKPTSQVIPIDLYEGQAGERAGSALDWLVPEFGRTPKTTQ